MARAPWTEWPRIGDHVQFARSEHCGSRLRKKPRAGSRSGAGRRDYCFLPGRFLIERFLAQPPGSLFVQLLLVMDPLRALEQHTAGRQRSPSEPVARAVGVKQPPAIIISHKRQSARKSEHRLQIL